ncbi:MAG: DUF4296 domain-containing protein [Flavobacteriales bacterium]
METMLANVWHSAADSSWVSATALLVVLATGCAPEPVGLDARVSPPEGILSRAEFVAVLAEVQVVEAASNQRYFRNDNERVKLAEAYNDVWHRTGVSAEAFEASHAWWWAHPEAMKGVLRDVVDVLKDMEVASNRADGKAPDDASSVGDLKNRTPGGTPAPSSK